MASDKPVTSVLPISQHRERYKPSKNGAICASAYISISSVCTNVLSTHFLHYAFY